MLIDTHAHLNFKDFDMDRDEVIKRSLQNNVWLINASSTFNTSKKAVEIAQQYPKGVYAAVGLHPIHVKEGFDREAFKELAKSKKVVAIGETGLDYMYPGDKQKEIFLEQLSLARELNLPVILHCRKAHDDMIEILEKQKGLRGVVHCFSSNWSRAKKYLNMGLYLGFNGIIYKMNLEEVIKKTPLDRILLETDCPFLTPPQAEAKRNEPLFVKYIAQTVSEIKGEEVGEASFQNAQHCFFEQSVI